MKKYIIESNLYLRQVDNDSSLIYDYIVKIHRHHNTIDYITQIENVGDIVIDNNSIFWLIVYNEQVLGF